MAACTKVAGTTRAVIARGAFKQAPWDRSAAQPCLAGASGRRGVGVAQWPRESLATGGPTAERTRRAMLWCHHSVKRRLASEQPYEVVEGLADVPDGHAINFAVERVP